MKVVLVLTSGDALLQRVTMSSSILFIVHNLFAQDLYSFKQKRNLLLLLCQMSVKLKLEFKNKLLIKMQTYVPSEFLMTGIILQNCPSSNIFPRIMQ